MFKKKERKKRKENSKSPVARLWIEQLSLLLVYFKASICKICKELLSSLFSFDSKNCETEINIPKIDKH